MNWLAFKWWMTSLQHEDYFSKAYKFHWLFPSDKIMSEWVILIYTVQIMTCCLMSPSHLMEQFRVIFSMDCSKLQQTIYQDFPQHKLIPGDDTRVIYQRIHSMYHSVGARWVTSIFIETLNNSLMMTMIRIYQLIEAEWRIYVSVSWPSLSFKKMHLKMSCMKWRLSCLGPNVLIVIKKCFIESNKSFNEFDSCQYNLAEALTVKYDWGWKALTHNKLE